MLLNLLPGLRELRAPLAAGYLWLLAGWLALEDRISLPGPATDFLDEFSSLGNAAALTFIAYVVGSFLTDLLAGPWRYLLMKRRSRSRFRWKSPEVERRKRALDDADENNKARMISEWNREAELTAWALEAAGNEPLSWRGGDTLIRLVLAETPYLASDERDQRGELVPAPDRRRRDWAHQVVPSLPTADETRIRNRVAALAGELDIARFRLLAEQPDLHNEVDRLRGEGQFKLAIAAPLLALAIVVAVTEVPAWLAVLVPILAAIAIGIMAWQGLDRLEESGDRVADAIRAGQVTTPALEATKGAGVVLAGESRD